MSTRSIPDFLVDKYVIIDTETGGLDWRQHPLLEVSYAVGLNEPIVLYPNNLEKSIVDCSHVALALNKFDKRFPDGFPQGSGEKDWDDFAAALKDRYVIGSNPRFDLGFLEEFYRPEPLEYKYSLIDIKALAMGRWFSLVPPSLSTIIKTINEKEEAYNTGNYIPEQDHTAKGDVMATRAAFFWFQDYQVYRDLVHNELVSA